MKPSATTIKFTVHLSSKEYALLTKAAQKRLHMTSGRLNRSAAVRALILEDAR